MPARDPSASLDRLRTLLDRGPYPIRTKKLSTQVRSRARSLLLRALRPYTYFQHEVDTEVLSSLTAYEHDSHRIEMLERVTEDLIAAVETLRRRTAALDAIGPELHAMPYLGDAPFERFQAPVGQVTGYRANPPVPAGASWSVTFEALLGGPAEGVDERERPYLALLAGHEPVLDLGCGRDLEGIEDGSLGTVFCAGLIERLSVEDLRRLFDVAARKLRPGGLLIAETVNPHSVAALKTFWADLTRRRPIFPEAALALCASAGYRTAYVFAPGYEDFESARFESTRYAIVATAPDPGAS